MVSQIVPLGDHDRAAFSCGVPALDQYLKTQASQDRRSGVAAIYVLADGKRILGYYSLAATGIERRAMPDEVTGKMPRYPIIPAYLIGRLAVDISLQGQGYGRGLLADALRRCVRLAVEVAAALVVVDAKDDSARTFYERTEFALFPEEPNRLYVTMGALRRNLLTE